MSDLVGFQQALHEAHASAHLQPSSSNMTEDAQNTTKKTREFCSKIFLASTLATLFCLAGTVFGFTAVAMFLLNNPLAAKVAIASAACIASSIVMQTFVNCCIVRQMHAHTQQL